MPETSRKNTPRLRDGVMKRGTTWSYVIRVKDPETGVSKPRWGGGFATEDDAKAARDEARVKARHGEYSTGTGSPWRSTWTTGSTRTRWRSSRAPSPTTGPASGSTRRRASAICRSRPSGRRPSPSCAETCCPRRSRWPAARHSHRGPSARRAQEGVPRCRHRGRTHRQRPGGAGQAAASAGPGLAPLDHRPAPGDSWPLRSNTSCSPSSTSPPTRSASRRAAQPALRDIDLDGKKITLTGSTAVIAGERVNGTTKSGRTRVLSIDDESMPSYASARPTRPPSSYKAATPGAGTRTATSSRPDGRADLPRYHHVPDDQAHPRQPAATPRTPTQPTAPARHDLALSRVPVHVVAARLGHADPAITLRVSPTSSAAPRPPPRTLRPGREGRIAPRLLADLHKATSALNVETKVAF